MHDNIFVIPFLKNQSAIFCQKRILADFAPCYSIYAQSLICSIKAPPCKQDVIW